MWTAILQWCDSGPSRLLTISEPYAVALGWWLVSQSEKWKMEWWLPLLPTDMKLFPPVRVHGQHISSSCPRTHNARKNHDITDDRRGTDKGRTEYRRTMDGGTDERTKHYLCRVSWTLPHGHHPPPHSHTHIPRRHPSPLPSSVVRRFLPANPVVPRSVPLPGRAER